MSNESRKNGIIDNGKHKKYPVKKWTSREYHVQQDKYVEHQYVNMYCATKQSHELKFIYPHNKPHGVCGLGNNYHML